MSQVFDRLVYLTQEHTQTWISQETGIPQSTLSYVLSGDRNLPSEYNISVTNTYARTVYSVFRGYGFSSDISRSYRYYKVETINSMTKEINDLLGELALGHMSRFYPDIDIESDTEEFNRLLQKQIKDITEGIRFNQTTIEEFFDYPV